MVEGLDDFHTPLYNVETTDI